jgi:hypothetical protein
VQHDAAISVHAADYCISPNFSAGLFVLALVVGEAVHFREHRE